MKIFIMRHGEAEVRAKSDQTRHLTAYGIKQAFAQGQWLKTHLESTALERVIVSPYIRTQETFEQVNQAFNGELSSKMETWEGITPYGNAETVADYFSVLRDEGLTSVLMISHLPLGGEVVAELYGKRNPISFYPATIAQLDWSDQKAHIEIHKYSAEML